MVQRLSDDQREQRFEFLKRRQGGVGGSDLPVILGLVEGRNALDIYHDKTRPIKKEQIEDDTIHQLRGHAFEGMAVEHYWLRTGRRGRATPGKVVVHPDFPQVVGSTDFEIFADAEREEGKRGTGVGEVKSPTAAIFRRVHEDGLRNSELVQLQVYIAASRRGWGSFAYFNMEDGNGPVLAVDQLADQEMGDFLLRAGQRFWDEHVARRNPPDIAGWKLAGMEAPPLKDMAGDLMELEAEGPFAAQVSRLLDAKDLRKEANENYDKLKEEVLEALVERGIAKGQIPGLARLTVVTKPGQSRVQLGTLRESLPLDRDLVAKWLMEASLPLNPDTDEFRAEVGRMLFECELDFARFEKEGSPSRYLLPNRRS